MFTYSNTQLIGRLTKDPEVKQSQGGKSYVNFAIATERAFKDSKGEWQRTSIFHNCTAFGDLADKIGTLKKGKKIHVVGEYLYDEKDEKRYYKVLVSSATFIDWEKGQAGEGQKTASAGSASASAPAPAAADDDIPF